MQVDIREAHALPVWRRPEALLMVMALAMPLAFSVWMALLNNFTVEAANFDGKDIGWLQTVREIPGFLAFLVVYLLLFLREQTLAMVSLLLLGLATAATGLLPSFWGLMLTTVIGSLGFHYYETVNQSLQLQWLEKKRAPIVLGRLAGVGSSTAFLAFGAIWLFSQPEFAPEGPPYVALYIFGGAATVALALYAWLAFPRFQAPSAQRREIVLKPRYWLYYALVFMEGARRQIFVVFAGFMMVQKFGFELHEFVALLIINHAVNVFFAPFMGRMTGHFGERAVLTFEYAGLILVFAAYAIVEDPMIAAGLYIIDHLFFGLHFASRTYFQKISDAEDIAPTAAVSFTINHIAAVFLPASLGYLYIISPGAVFWIGVAMAFVSLGLARLIPRHPDKGAETILSDKPKPQAEAHPAE
ncbi:MAG: MFS transporter [Rhodobacteraceae bacterium]|nr:MFS transporter [Paracoccaceae bacterium]